ncbi:ABC transporter ATP-binding protein [Halostagnicola kamekurae]|uniref:Molybdate/tungstate import ATP-binding protein WtpC n=1 Tax=Halostagnicola kamekurae TaxID=619731 RepID=A0A1I6P5D4_9EURY|nr:ABC transporter ATP-binding protein [Halostagnicola kamekurae]SFS35395.1 thiamine transport system ATP-binding protein [Halostagnicola kamekurae]
MTELRLESVSKRYGSSEDGTAALESVDLRVRDGEFFTLVGPSGCGKTTTLRTIAGFEEPTTGTVSFDGAPATGTKPENRDVGVVFQNYALFSHMTVAENVGYGLQFLESEESPSSEQRIEELLELVNLEGMGDREPEQLSGGQQQRVALARALAPEPSVLLLDEPMSALDARLRESLRRQLKRIQERLEITTVYVTHDQEEALAVSDRVAVMNDGAVEQVGPPETVYRDPASRFVAEFVGDNNVFEARVLESNAEETRVEIADRTFRMSALEGERNLERSGERGLERTDERGPERSGDPCQPSVGDRVTICIRPEHLSRTASTNRFPVTVETSEFLGPVVRVHGRWNGMPVVLLLEEAPAEELTVGFAPEDARLVERSP